MLLMTVVMIVGQSKFIVEGMNATMFALNYRHGVVARGLFGSILDVICRILGDRFYCYNTVFIFSTIGYILYLAVLWYFGKLFIRAYGESNYAKAFVMMIAPFFIEMYMTSEGYGRTDMYLLILSLIAGYAVLKDRGMILCVICPAIGILIHEGYAFDYYNIVLACLIYKIVFHGAKKRSKYIIWLGISILVSLFVFFWVFSFSKSLFPVSEEMFEGIVSDAQRLAAPGQDVHYDALRAYVLGVDLYDSELEFLADARISTCLFILMFIPIILKIRDIIKAIYKESSHKEVVMLLCMGSLTTVPLFIRKCDYGRWIFAAICYYLALLCLLVITENKVVKKVFMEQVEKIAHNQWEVIFYTIYFMLFIPFQTVYVDRMCRSILVGIIRGAYY